MKKIILSVAVATMALSTAAAALEDIKVSGQAKVWYETNNAQDNDMFSKNQGVDAASTATNANNTALDNGKASGTTGEVVFKLAMTGKQGNVGFGATIYDISSMGLETSLVSDARSTTSINADMYVGEMYITAPIGAKTLLKLGKQELDTPLAFTERWNATPNTFNAAVAINNSIDNLTLIAAYVGQGSGGTGTAQTPTSTGSVLTGSYSGESAGTYAVAGLYKNDAIAVNVWAYELASLANAIWIDAAMKVGPAHVKAYAAQMMPKGTAATMDDTTGLALSAGMDVSGIKLFAAVSNVSDTNVAGGTAANGIAVGNTATNYKKTKLPTAGVYTDGLYVAQTDSTAVKVKAAGKLGSTGIALQVIDNSNDRTKTLETTEIDLILSQKVGDFNLKAILMDRSFDLDTEDKRIGGQHVRIIASVNF